MNGKLIRTAITASLAFGLAAAASGATPVAGLVTVDHRGHYQDRHPGPERARAYDRRIRLHLPVQARGARVLPLRRMARRNHRIDLDRFRLVEVIVAGHARNHRGGAVGLRAGRYYMDQRLNGRTVFRVPDIGRKAHWTLDVHRGRVDHVVLVLEPRRRYRRA